MEWRIVYTEKFRKALRSLEQAIAFRVVREVGVLMDNPFIGKPLKGLFIFVNDNKYRVYSLRVGDYRVAYIVSHLEKTVYLLHVAHRRSIYKELKRLLKP